MYHRLDRTILRRLWAILFLCSLALSLWLGQVGTPATAQSPDASQLVQQGIERYQSGDYRGAIEPWQTALTLYQNNPASEAIVLENIARAYQQLDRSEDAISYWELAIAAYRQIDDRQQVGRLLAEQAQAYSSIGQPRKAIALLCGVSDLDEDCAKGEESAIQITRSLQDRAGEVAALGSLGEAYRLMGKYDKAVDTLEAGLAIVREIDRPDYHFSVLNSLGNAYFSKAQLNEQRADSARLRNATHKVKEFLDKATSDYEKALNYFKTSLKLARTQNSELGQVRSLFNLIQLYYHPKASSLETDSSEADAAVREALALLARLPDSPNKVYAAIDLTEINPSIRAQCSPRKLGESEAEALLNQAVSIARRIQDPRSESFALGKLGHFYECRKDYEQALEITQQARWAADQNLRAKDSLYLWEWQAARIFLEQGKEAEAIAAYERAIATLEGRGGIRDNLLIAERDLQFNFRDAINPLYREFARLRLERAESLPTDSQAYQKELDSALNTIDSLKLAELQNYFGDDCVLTVFDRERIDDLERDDTVVFSSIVLEERTAILASLPNPENKRNPNAAKRLKKLEWVEDSQGLRAEIANFRLSVQEFYDPTEAYLTSAQNLYDRLIRPFASDLDPAQIKTLVFIQDGILRSIPMAALHDGEKFLVQNYAIATTPGLRLTSPQALNREGLQVLALGLTEEAIVDGEKFSALANVGVEVERVTAQFPGSKKLLNDQFTRDRFQQELEQTTYPIIHIATHGKFGTLPEDTFLVTGNNEKIAIPQLESDIRRFSREADPVELLALTACQTGIGDDRMTLGLAGITVQAGVRSALASLWFIDDAATQALTTQFYENLRSGTSKAEALKEAQKGLIEQGIHPAQWAPFILIGNWL